MARLWRSEIFVWQEFRIKWVVIAEILALEPLGIDFVFLGEFVFQRAC